VNLLPLDKLLESMPFWDLFESLREAKLPLDVEQYHELKQLVRWGHVLTWEDLATVGSVVWVKPSDGDWQQKVFDRILQEYRNQPDEDLAREIPVPSPGSSSDSPENHSEIRLKLPDFPMRSAPQGEHKIAAGLKSPRSSQLSVNQKWKFNLEKLPLSAHNVKDSWLAWRQSNQPAELAELDVRETVQRSTEGFLEKLVWQRLVNYSR
jgi:uncharacterized protein with von Willebrand factor type A (vWA) domain